MRAADGDMLARQLVDVALLPEGGVDGAPRLLTVAQERRVPGTSRLTVMERVAGRWAVRTETEDAPPILKATRTPWLVALDERRFALLAVAPDLGETWIRTVRWSGEQLQLGRRRAVPLLADVAGTADVDGDGTSELVVGEATTRRGGPTCQGSRLAVLDLPTMATRATHDIPNLRLAAGAVGPLDGEPGDDLFATAFRNCPAGPASAYRLATTVVRLSDGQVVLDRPLAAADLMTAWSGRPVVTDLDGDGTAEGLVGSRDGLVTVDLARDRRTQPLTMLPGILEGAIPLAGGGALVATRSSDSIVLGLVSASPDGPRAAVTTVLGSDRIGMRRWEAATVDGRSAALRFRGGPAWIDRSAGCPTLVVASAIVDCGSRRFESGRSALPGPAWLGVRPIAALEGHPDRSILVARSVAPVGAPGRFGAPGPLAVEPAGASWRHGPSAPFTLAEVPATQLWAATPAVEVAPNTVAGPAMAVDVAPGARVLADVVHRSIRPRGRDSGRCSTAPAHRRPACSCSTTTARAPSTSGCPPIRRRPPRHRPGMPS